VHHRRRFLCFQKVVAGSVPLQQSCLHFPLCGGCEYQDVPYPKQLEDKQIYLEHLFARFKAREFRPIIPSPQLRAYRNKMEYAVGGSAEAPCIGLRRKKQHRALIDVQECPVFSPDTRALLDVFRDWMRTLTILPYDVYKHTGQLRYVTVRHAKYTDEMLVSVVMAAEPAQIERERQTEKYRWLVERLSALPMVRSIYACANSSWSDTALTDAMILLWGTESVTERINDRDYQIGPRTFFQTNSFCCARLYEEIRRQVGVHAGRTLDLYCGCAGITLQVADAVSEVVGVDNLPANIDQARVNARLNGVTNATFICADAQELIRQVAAGPQQDRFETIIVDPPRVGLTRKSRQLLLASQARAIVYVSCNPLNLAEDLKILTTEYAVESITGVDMFPYTRHMEVVAGLRRQ